jgi:hypothetical protein
MPDISRQKASMFRKLLIALAGAVAFGLLGLYALSIWIFARRQQPAISKPKGGLVIQFPPTRTLLP